MMRQIDFEAFILAGGASSRMGRPKGLVDFGGTPLILRIAEAVAPLVDRVTVIGSPEIYSRSGLRVIPDREFGPSKKRSNGIGPVAGIATALSVARAQWNLI